MILLTAVASQRAFSTHNITWLLHCSANLASVIMLCLLAHIVNSSFMYLTSVASMYHCPVGKSFANAHTNDASIRSHSGSSAGHNLSCTAPPLRPQITGTIRPARSDLLSCQGREMPQLWVGGSLMNAPGHSRQMSAELQLARIFNC